MFCGNKNEEICNENVCIPYELTDKCQMLVVNEDGIVLIKLWPNNATINDYYLDTATVLQKEEIQLNKNIFHVPEIFLSYIKKDMKVVICGVGDHIEIINASDFEKMFSGKESILKQMISEFYYEGVQDYE